MGRTCCNSLHTGSITCVAFCWFCAWFASTSSTFSASICNVYQYLLINPTSCLLKCQVHDDLKQNEIGSFYKFSKKKCPMFNFLYLPPEHHQIQTETQQSRLHRLYHQRDFYRHRQIQHFQIFS